MAQNTCYKTLKETVDVNPETVRELYLRLVNKPLDDNQPVSDAMLENAYNLAFGDGMAEENNATAALKLYLLSQKTHQPVNLKLAQLMSLYGTMLRCEQVPLEEWLTLQKHRFVFPDPSKVFDPFVFKLTQDTFVRAYPSPAPQQDTPQVRSVAAMLHPFMIIPREEWLEYKNNGTEILVEPTAAQTPFIVKNAKTGQPMRLYAGLPHTCDIDTIHKIVKDATPNALQELFKSQASNTY